MDILDFIRNFLTNMNMKAVVLLIGFGLVLVEAFPQSSSDGSSQIREQAEQDYSHHQDVLRSRNIGSAPQINGGIKDDGSLSLTFDNGDQNSRDRGYGYEKAYAYSRETAYFDFLADKPSLNAREIVEKFSKKENEQNDDLLGNISH